MTANDPKRTFRGHSTLLLLPTLIGRWRELVEGIEDLARNPNATPDDINAARSHIRALLGPVTLEPKDGVLWAHPSPDAKSLVETRPLVELHINSRKMVAGAGFALFLQ